MAPTPSTIAMKSVAKASGALHEIGKNAYQIARKFLQIIAAMDFVVRQIIVNVLRVSLKMKMASA